METKETITGYDKAIAFLCWVFPVLSLILLFIRSTPLFVKHHAQWSLLLPIVLVFTLTPLAALLEATASFTFDALAVATTIYYVIGLFNLLALLSGKAPWNRPVLS